MDNFLKMLKEQGIKYETTPFLQVIVHDSDWIQNQEELPDNLIIKGNVKLAKLKQIPKGLHVKGRLVLENVEEIPHCLVAEEVLVIDKSTDVVFPDYFEVFRDLVIRNSKVITMPTELTALWLDIENSEIDRIPERLKVSQLVDFDVLNSVKGWAEVENCGILRRTVRALYTRGRVMVYSGCFAGTFEEFKERLYKKDEYITTDGLSFEGQLYLDKVAEVVAEVKEQMREDLFIEQLVKNNVPYSLDPLTIYRSNRWLEQQEWLPDNLVVYDNLYLSNVKELPKNLTVDLSLDVTSVKRIPSCLRVSQLTVRNTTDVVFPKKFNAGERLNLINCEIKRMPEDLTVERFMMLKAKIDRIPEKIKVERLDFDFVKNLRGVLQAKFCGHNGRLVSAVYINGQIMVSVGCFLGTLEEFETRLKCNLRYTKQVGNSDNRVLTDSGIEYLSRLTELVNDLKEQINEQ